MLDSGGSVDATPGFPEDSLSTENVNFLVSIPLTSGQWPAASNFQMSDLHLQLQCLEVVGENDDEILAEFTKEVLSDNIEEIVCTEAAKYCDKKDGDSANDNEREEL